MFRFTALFVGVAVAEEVCSDATCAPDEATLLQINGLRKKAKTAAPGAEHYLGCFVEDGSRDLGSMIGGTNDGGTNTFENCRAACGDSLYMSLQYGGECFCADSYGNGDQYVQVADSECNSNCAGGSDNSHNCGGTWRQAIYAIDEGANAYIGCFVDDGSRDLGAMVGGTGDTSTNTYALCRARCAGSQFMSLQYGGECFCADSFGNGDQYVEVDSSECNREVEPCSSNSFNCGGTWRQAIYEIGEVETGAKEYVGCFVDDGSRDLGSMRGGTNDGSTNTFALCRAECAGSQYMSLQYGGECFCADSIQNGDQYDRVDDDECNSNCAGGASNSFNCGGTWRQAIYEIGEQSQGAKEYIGCFVDDGSRDLGGMVGSTSDSSTNTFENCRAACGDSNFMSLQYGGECFCSDSYGNGDQYSEVDRSECNRDVDPCSSNSFNCGGTWRQAIYDIGR